MTGLSDFKYGIAFEVCRTTDGQQTFTASNFGGGTPTAALFFITYDTNGNGTPVVDAGLCIGAATATDAEWCFTATDEDDLSTTSNTGNDWESDQCLQLLAVGDESTVLIEADFIEFTTNGVTVDWTTTDGVAYFVKVILFGGTGLSVACENFQLSATRNADVTVSSLSFEPDLLFLTGGFYNGTGPVNHYRQGFGVSVNTGEVIPDNMGMTIGSSDNASPSSITGRLILDSNLYWHNGNDGYYIHSFASDGFKARTILSAGLTNHVGFLALKFTDRKVGIRICKTPHAAAAQKYTLDVKPEFVMLLYKDSTMLGRPAGSLAGQFTIGTFTAFNFPMATTGARTTARHSRCWPTTFCPTSICSVTDRSKVLTAVANSSMR